MKILQRVIETFYKAQPFEYIFKGKPWKGRVAFPEDFGVEDVYEFSFGDPTQKKLNFTVAVEARLPVVDETQEFQMSERIEKFNLNTAFGNLPKTVSLDNEPLTQTDFSNFGKPSVPMETTNADIVVPSYTPTFTDFGTTISPNKSQLNGDIPYNATTEVTAGDTSVLVQDNTFVHSDANIGIIQDGVSSAQSAGTDRMGNVIIPPTPPNIPTYPNYTD